MAGGGVARVARLRDTTVLSGAVVAGGVRELDCDFCGATAAGTYEIGPAPPERSPSDRRRLVLCEDCRVTLADAIQPLLDRLAAAEDGEPVQTGDESVGERDGSVGERDGSIGERDESIGERDGSVDTSGRAAGNNDESEKNRSADPLGESGAATGSGSTVSGAGDAVVADTETDRTETNEASTGGDETAEADRSTDTAETTDANATADTDGPPETEPPQFRKVVRLLNNRSFPVERAEFVELAANAYDLDESTVAESLAYAVDRDVLAVEDGQIVRG